MDKNYILTNDDGIDAPGIRALHKALNGNKIFIAPSEHKSGCGHQVSTDKPFSFQKRNDSEFAIQGTPADCVRLIPYLVDEKIDWVISGINAGGNLGVDLYISGTAAAAREAAILGIKSIAISHWIRDRQPIDWERAIEYAKLVFSELLAKDLDKGCFWNVNIPHVFVGEPDPKLIYCDPSTDPLDIQYEIIGNQITYKGVYPNRKKHPSTDVGICFSGNISISKVKV